MTTLTLEELHQHIAEIAPNAVDVMCRALATSPSSFKAAVERGEIAHTFAIACLVKLTARQAIEIGRLRERLFELETDPLGGDAVPLARPRTTVVAPTRAGSGC